MVGLANHCEPVHLVKTTLLIIGWGVFAVGLALLGYDLNFHLTWGCDVTDVAGADQWGLIDWPTGERPAWATVPAYGYGLVLWGLAFTLLGIRHRLGQKYSGRICRGAK